MRRAAPLLILLFMLSGCGREFLAPSEARPAAGAANDPRPRVAFCYNGTAATREQLNALARQACGTDMTPRYVEDRLSPSACPALTPSRITFICERATR